MISMISMILCSLGFLLSERTSGVSPVIFYFVKKTLKTNEHQEPCYSKTIFRRRCTKDSHRQYICKIKMSANKKRHTYNISAHISKSLHSPDYKSPISAKIWLPCWLLKELFPHLPILQNCNLCPPCGNDWKFLPLAYKTNGWKFLPLAYKTNDKKFLLSTS